MNHREMKSSRLNNHVELAAASRKRLLVPIHVHVIERQNTIKNNADVATRTMKDVRLGRAESSTISNSRNNSSNSSSTSENNYDYNYNNRSNINNNNNNSNSDDNASIDSLSTVEDLLEDDPLIMAVEDATAAVQEPMVVLLNDNDPQKKEIDVAKYMAEREMTPLQERINALTMVPNPLYCLYFILSECWVSQSLVQQYRDDADSLSSFMLNFDASGCYAYSMTTAAATTTTSTPWYLPVAMPPATILAVLYGVAIHAPFSFLYHWKYALLPNSTSHWSRRMDHSMIHVAAMFLAYASSGGSWDYTWVNILFNADCVYRQFQPKVRPRRNQIRVGMSILAYTIPIWMRGDFLVFSRLWFVMLVAGWFFVRYPIGGWSHAIFHLMLCGLPYFMMQVASKGAAESAEMHYAAQCTAFAAQY